MEKIGRYHVQDLHETRLCRIPVGHLEHYFRPELPMHIAEFKKVIPYLSLDKAKILEQKLESGDKEYYEKIRAEVTTELESEFLAKYKDEIRKIAISAIKEIEYS